MLPILAWSLLVVHSNIAIVVLALDLLVVFEAEEVLQLGEVLLMARHEVINIVYSFHGGLVPTT